MMKTVRKFFGEFDMFAAPPTLRARQEDKTSSLCSGVTSFLLALFFSYVFIYSVIGVVTYTKIDSVQTQTRLQFNVPHAEDVFFGIRVGYIPFQISMKYFEVGYFIVSEDGTNTTYQMQRCSSEQWKKLGDDYENQYNKFGLNDFYCKKPQNKIDLKKVFYAPNSQYAVVYIRPCTTSTRSTCQTLANQTQFIQNLSNLQGAIFVSIYFLDQAINPNSKQPIQRFTNTDAEVAFTSKRGIISTIELGSYQVDTDMSVFPVEEFKTQSGNFVHSFRQTSIQIKNSSDNLALIYLTMNRKHILVQRKVGKLDDMLSYAGGLFSIIIGFLSIFIASFNKYRYQLMVAQGIFHEDQSNHVIKQHHFTFLLYVKYTIFDWISTLFCYQPQWEDCQIVEKTRDQANKQIDVTKLFRKLQNLETAVNHIVKNKNQRCCLALLKPESLSGIIHSRLILQYYDLIVQGRQSLTFQQHRISSQILKFALSISKNEQLSHKNKVVNLDLNDTNQDLSNEFEQINYQELANKDYLLNIIQSRFSSIVKGIDSIQLQQQHKQVQIQLSQAYFSLDIKKRMLLQDRIPIIILYRLLKCHRNHQKQGSNSQTQMGNEQRKKKKVVLNFGGANKIFDSYSNNADLKFQNYQ